MKVGTCLLRVNQLKRMVEPPLLPLACCLHVVCALSNVLPPFPTWRSADSCHRGARVARLCAFGFVRSRSTGHAIVRCTRFFSQNFSTSNGTTDRSFSYMHHVIVDSIRCRDFYFPVLEILFQECHNEGVKDIPSPLIISTLIFGRLLLNQGHQF